MVKGINELIFGKHIEQHMYILYNCFVHKTEIKLISNTAWKEIINQYLQSCEEKYF